MTRQVDSTNIMHSRNMTVLFILAGIAMLLWGNWYVETSLEKSRAESVGKKHKKKKVPFKTVPYHEVSCKVK